MRKLGVMVLVVVATGCGKGGVFSGGGGGGGAEQNQPVSYWIEQLKNPDEEKRKRAVKILVQNAKDQKDLILELIDHLESGNNKDQRIAICDVLGRIGWDADPAAIGPLKKLIRGNDDDVRNAAALALYKINKDEARSVGVVESEIKKSMKK